MFSNLEFIFFEEEVSGFTARIVSWPGIYRLEVFDSCDFYVMQRDFFTFEKAASWFATFPGDWKEVDRG